MCGCDIFFFNDTATTEIYTLSLHDALPICGRSATGAPCCAPPTGPRTGAGRDRPRPGSRSGAPAASLHRHPAQDPGADRSEEHTSELQSRQYLVCRLLLEKKNTITTTFFFC